MAGFNRLSPRRPQGMNGPLRIPVSEIESYCRLMSYDHGRRQEFFLYIERMDDVYMEYVAKVLSEDEKKREAQRSKTAPGKTVGRR